MPVARATSVASGDNTGSSRASSGRLTIVILTFLTFAGAWLRLSHLGTKSLWLDEGATVTIARASWQRFVWIWWHGEAGLQSIYFLFMRGWVHLGTSEAWLRLPSAIFGTLAIPVLYGVGRRFAGAAGSLAAAAMLAFSPAHVEYSQEARGYTLAILLVLLSTYFFVRAVEGGRAQDWAWWTVLGVAAFYTHDFTALVLVAQAISLFFRPPPVPWRKFLLYGAIIFVAAIPGLTYVFRASPENLYFAWMPHPTPKQLWHLLMFFGGSGVKVWLAMILWAAGVIAIWRRRSEPAAFWRGMLVVLWAVSPAAILALASLREPMFLERYMIFSLPAAVLLAGMGVEYFARWRAGLMIAVALCAMCVPAIARSYNKPREDWRGASDFILRSASPGDAVAFSPFYTRIMLDYYAQRYGANAPSLNIFAPEYYAGGKDVRDLLRAIGQNPSQFRHVWVVVSDKPSPKAEFSFGVQLLRRLQAVYGNPSQRDFADLRVLEFGRR